MFWSRTKKKQPANPVALPAIDLALPSQIETATFALG